MEPLSQDHKQAVFNLVYAYADFWKAVPGRRGWEIPPFTFAEVRPLLERAAEIVVRIRASIDESNQANPPRSIDGSAHEYLFTLKKNPNQFPDRFVRFLVHATLRNSSGYVDGLNAEQIDHLIAKFDPAVAHTGANDDATQARLKALLANLSEAWGHACMAVGSVLAEDAESFVAHHNRWDIPKLERLISDAWNLSHSAKTMFGVVPHKHRRKHAKKAQGAAAAAAAAAPATTGAAAAGSAAEQGAARAARAALAKTGSVCKTCEEPEQHEQEGTASDEELPFPAAAPSSQEEKPFNVGVQRVEKDISEIHEQLQSLTKALVEEDINLRENPETGKSLVTILLQRCREYIEALAGDMAVIKGLHLPAPQEGTEVRHLQQTAEEVIQLTQRLAVLGNTLEEELTASSTKSEAGSSGNPEIDIEAEAVPVPPAAPKESPAPSPAMSNVQSWFRALKLEPRVDIHETDAAYVLQMFVPGMKQEDMEIMVNKDNVLVIKGFRPPTEDALTAMAEALPKPFNKEALLQLGVGQYGTFAEFFQLPAEVDITGISGDYDHGLLQVSLPKRTASAGGDAVPSDPHSLLRHPMDSTPRRRAMFRSSPAAPQPQQPQQPHFAGQGQHVPRAPLHRSNAFMSAPVMADPRSFGMMGAQRAGAMPPFAAHPAPWEQAHADAEEPQPAAAPEMPQGSGAGKGQGMPTVQFVDPSTGATFAVPLEVFQQMLAEEMQKHQAPTAGQPQPPQSHGQPAPQRAQAPRFRPASSIMRPSVLERMW